MIILRLLDPVFGHFGQASPRLGLEETDKKDENLSG